LWPRDSRCPLKLQAHQDRLGAASVKRQPNDEEEKQSRDQTVVQVELEYPIFSTVRAVLQRGGYTFSSSYCRPCGTEFPTVDKLRSDLCAYGVSCRCVYKSNGGEELPCLCWNDNDKRLIHNWVRYNVIRGPCPSRRVSQLTRAQAYHYIRRLGFGIVRSRAFEGNGWGYPKVKTATDGIVGVTIFQSFEGLMLSLCRFGLPETCEFGNLSDDERLSLELYMANYYSVANTL
jgi:hypothetical protein